MKTHTTQRSMSLFFFTQFIQSKIPTPSTSTLSFRIWIHSAWNWADVEWFSTKRSRVRSCPESGLLHWARTGISAMTSNWADAKKIFEALAKTRAYDRKGRKRPKKAKKAKKRKRNC